MPLNWLTIIELVVLAAAVLLLAGALWLTRRRQRARMTRLRDEIEEIARGEQFHERVSRSDAAGVLAELEDSVNRVLEAVQRRERELLRRDQLFRSVAEGVDHAIVIHCDHKIRYANPGLASLRGARQSDLVGQTFTDLVHPEQREIVQQRIDRLLGGQPPEPPLETRFLDRYGNGVWVQLSCRPIDFEGHRCVLSVARDLSHRKALEGALEQGKIQTRVTLESLAEGVVTTDVFGKIDYLNSAAEQLIGVRSADALGRGFSDLVHLVEEGDRRAIADPVTTCLERRQRVALGGRALLIAPARDTELSVELSASPVTNLAGDIVGVAVVMRDVSELRGLTRQMTYQASHDPLTGLINRREFQRRLDEALIAARGGAAGHALCYLDLDRFKTVNDTCGHAAGDNLLREVAGIIKDKVRDSDSVGRLGGDEFGLLLSGCPLDKARQIAGDVVEAVDAYRFVWRDKIFALGVSIGLVEVGRESGSLEQLMSAADSACYIAKQEGRGRVHVYSARDEATARHRGEILWLQRLQVALKEGRFELHTQPIVAANGVGKSGPAVEILLRLRAEDGREVSPVEFIQAAERYHLMTQIDRWVVQTALAAIGREALRIPEGRSCAINLSGQTLGDEQFLEFVVECLDRTGVSPAQVCFEVTEASVVGNLKHAHRFVEVLHGMGCQFALDDFGSGLGSFANLKSMAIDFLKIDGSYTRDLATDTVNQAMVAALVKLSRSLKFRVVAEQIEDQESYEAVRAMGVDYVQGYAVGRPQSLRESAAVATG